MDAYRETLAWLYSDPAALDAYAKWAGVTPALAKQVRDEFYPRANMEPDRIRGLDALSQEAVGLKFLAAPLRPEQLHDAGAEQAGGEVTMRRHLSSARCSRLHWPDVADAETLKLAVGQRGNWDTSVAELGQRAGIFKKHGLELEILYTVGRRRDAAGGAVALRRYRRRRRHARRARRRGEGRARCASSAPRPPARPTSTGMCRRPRRCKTVADLAGKTVAFSTVGSSTDTVGRMAMAQFGVPFRMVATGSPPATFTQTMSGQIDVGWAAAPFGVEALRDGKIRAIFRGGEIKAAQGQTIRVLLTHAAVLAQKKPQLIAFMQAYRETIDAMYADDAVLKDYAAFAGVPEAVARRHARPVLPARPPIDPDQISGLDAVMDDGVRFKFMAAPLAAEQLSQVVVLDQLR